MTPERSEEPRVPEVPVEQPAQMTPPTAIGVQEFAAIPFGPGHPLYHEGGNAIIRGTLNVCGLVTTGLVKHLAWRERNKERSAEWSQAMRQRSEARHERWKADSEARTHLHHIQMAAIRTGNPNAQRAFLEGKRKYWAGRAAEIGQSVVELSTAQPRRYQAKIRRQEKKQAKYEGKARKAAAELIRLY